MKSLRHLLYVLIGLVSAPAFAQYSMFGTGIQPATDCPQPKWTGPEEEEVLGEIEDLKSDKQDLDISEKRREAREAKSKYEKARRKHISNYEKFINMMEEHSSKNRTCNDYQNMCEQPGADGKVHIKATIGVGQNSDNTDNEFSRMPAGERPTGAEMRARRAKPTAAKDSEQKPTPKKVLKNSKPRKPTKKAAVEPDAAPTTPVACGAGQRPTEANPCEPTNRPPVQPPVAQGPACTGPVADPLKGFFKPGTNSETAYAEACPKDTRALSVSKLCAHANVKDKSGRDAAATCASDLADVEESYKKFKDAEDDLKKAEAESKRLAADLKKLKKDRRKAARADAREAADDPNYQSTEGSYCANCGTKFERKYSAALNVAGNVALGLAGMAVFKDSEKYRVSTNAKLGAASETTPALFAGYPYFAQALGSGLSYYGATQGNNMLCSGSTSGGGAFGANGLGGAQMYGSIGTPYGYPSWLTGGANNSLGSMYLPGINPWGVNGPYSGVNPYATLGTNPLLAGGAYSNPYLSNPYAQLGMTNPYAQLGMTNPYASLGLGNGLSGMAGLLNPYANAYNPLASLGMGTGLGTGLGSSLGTGLIDPTLQSQLLQQQSQLQQQMIQAQLQAYQAAASKQAAVTQQTQAITAQISQLMQQLALIQTTGYLGGVSTTGTGYSTTGLLTGTSTVSPTLGSGVSTSTAPR